MTNRIEPEASYTGLVDSPSKSLAQAILPKTSDRINVFRASPRALASRAPLGANLGRGLLQTSHRC